MINKRLIGILALSLLLFSFPVSAEFGTESCFNTVNTEYNAVAMLDSTHVVVAYKDTGGDSYGCAKIGVISGNNVTWGAENVFNAASTRYISISTLNTTHFVVVYQDDGGADYGCARVGLVSGNTISSYGTENIFNSAITNYISVSTLDTTHFIVVYRDDGGDDYGCARVGLVSGTTINSYGAENIFNSGSTTLISVDTFDSTHFVVCYRDGGNANQGTGIIGVTSGTTISSYGAENIFNPSSTTNIYVSTLNTTHFVTVYQDFINSQYGTGIIGVISGTTISSYGAENVFNSAVTPYISVDTLDDNHFVISYQDDGGDDYGCSIVGTTSGTTISSYGTENTYNFAVTVYTAITTLSSVDYVVVYQDDGGDDYGCGRVWGVLQSDISATLTPDSFTTNTIGCTNISFLIEHAEILNLSSLAVLVGINDTTINDYDNHFCMPSNSIAQSFLTHGNVLRNLNRNMSLSWENNITITEDDISKWGGFDNDSYQVTTNVVNATHTYINVTECSLLLHPSMYYLDPYEQINAPKIQVNIDRSQSIITKMWDNEVMHGRDQNFIISMFFDSYIDSTAIPNDDLKIWYCNSSYDPTVDEFQTCEFCAELKTYTVVDWENKVCTLLENASYISLSVNASDYTDPLPNSMNYVCFSSNTVSSKPYYINMTNYDPGICNRTFAQTDTTWLQNELSSLVTPYAYTPNNFYLFNRANQILEYHLYVADTTGEWLHSDIFQKEIVVGEYDPTTPVFNDFYIYCPKHAFRVSDTFMDATYDTYMFINITKGHDPDGGTVTHNLSLYYSNRTFIANINNSFPIGSVAVINFTCSDYYSGNDSYTFMCNVTDDEGNTSERWLGRNFTLGADGSQGMVYNGHISFWGYYDLPSLYIGVNNNSLMSYNAGGDIYTMHKPFFKSKLNDTFLINHTLHLESLNTEGVAYLRYRGILNIEDTNIHAWNTNTDTVAPITDLYRGYIKSLFAAHTHISNSELSNLGYDEFRREGLNYVQSVLVNITESILSYNSRGVIFEYTDDTVKVSDCTINNNAETGIGIYFVNNTLIHNNTFTDNGRTSLRLYQAYNNIITNNTMLNSGDYGTKLEYSSNNTYRNNSILNTNLIDVYLGYSSLNNYYTDSKDDIDFRTSSTSSLTVENSDNQVFSDTSDNTTSYAYPSNFSMLMDTTTIETSITNYDMYITPNNDRLEVNGIDWNGGYYHPIIINTSSPINITSVWFNITNPDWIQTVHNNNITIYRDSIEYSTIHNADDSGTLNYEYGAGYSSHEFEFKLTFTDEDLSTFAGVKRVFANTHEALQIFIDNVFRILPFLIGVLVILFVIIIAGIITNSLKRW